MKWWRKAVSKPHPRVFYVMKDTADLLVKVGVTNCLYDRMKHRRLGGHVPYKYVLCLSDPGVEPLFKKRFAYLKKETSGTETFYAAQEIRAWIQMVQDLSTSGLLPTEIEYRIYSSLEV